MRPLLTPYSHIFAKRAAIAGISLAIAIGLAGCPQKPPPPPVSPAQIMSIFTVGTVALQTGDPRALDRLTQALKMAPQEPAIWANIGLVRLRTNQLDAASFDLDRAQKLLPPDADPPIRAAILSLQAIVADKKGDPVGAVNYLTQAVNLNPDDLIARYALSDMQQHAHDDKAALQTLLTIVQKRPDNIEAWLQIVGLAATLNDIPTFREAVNALDKHSATWEAPPKDKLAILKQGMTNPHSVAINTHYLSNLLRRNADRRAGFAALNPPIDASGIPVLGVPLERFAKLPNAPDSPSAPDMTVTFTPSPINGVAQDTRYKIQGNAAPAFVGALWLSNKGNAPDLAAPFPMFADATALHIAAPAYANQPLALPGGGKAALPGPHGILALDFDYDLRADILMATPGGLKLYLQDATGHYADATAQMKLLPDVLNGRYAGAWGLDYDLDGDLDVLLARETGPPLILRNNGDGTFKPVALFQDVSGLRQFAWADLDGDGTPDAVLLDAHGGLHIYQNQRSGQFKPRTLPPDLGVIAAIAVSDINHDGLLDLLLLRTDGALVRLSDKRGTDWETSTLTTWANAPKDLAPSTSRLFLADLDNNGAPDVIASTATTAQVWMSDGNTLSPLPSPISAGITEIADVDNNGRLDLLGVDAQGQPVLLTNKGTKNYFWQDIRPRASESGEVSISQHRKGNSDSLSKRMNSYGIGGEIEARAGLLYQKQVIAGPSVHFGLGEYPTLDVVRILWPNGDVRGEFEIKGDAIIRAEHRMNVSCPFLFTWNGDRMEFVTDCIWRSPLGVKINAQDTAGIQMTEDWVKIRGDQLVPRPLSDVYDLRITAELWETHFFDHLSLMVVDHPEGTEIFCDERFAVPPPPLQVYAVTPPRPVSQAWDDEGEDITGIVRCRDGRHVANFGKGAYPGVTRDHWVELEFGDEVPTDGPLYLIAYGWIWPTNSSINVAMSQGDHPAPTGLSIQTPDAAGAWQTCKQNLGFPEGKLKTIVLRIDDVFMPGVARRLRLCTNLEIYWDALQWAVGLPDTELQTTRLQARTAELQYRGFSEIRAKDASSPELPVSYEDVERQGQKWRDLTGYYTRHGDVRELLQAVDDRYVIMNAGDEMRLTFDAPPPPPPGWERDFVLIGDGWVKDGNPNTMFSKTVLPLPAHDLPDYDTTPTCLEDDPVYRRHAGDWQTYHTRYVTPDGFAQGIRPFAAWKRQMANIA
jgi:hypothetical protein